MGRSPSIAALILALLCAATTPCPGAPASTPLPAAWRSFLRREPGAWRVRWEPGEAAPAMVRALGAAPLPGWERDHGRALGAFFARHRDVFGLRGEGDAFEATEEREHLGITHVRVRQLHRGLPVLGGEYMASVDRAGQLRMLAGRAVPVDDEPPLRPALPPARAETVARAAVPASGERPAATIELALRAGAAATRLVHVVHLVGERTPCEWRVVVDARDGAVLETVDLALRDGYTGVGRCAVAFPNPEHPLMDTTLVRLRDDVRLLEGRFVTALSQRADPVSRPDGRYYFAPCTTTVTPYPNPYDEVSAYWHTDHFLGTYLGGFGYAWPAAPLRVHVHEPATNLGLAWSTVAGTYFTQALTLGCCAEDADIVLHETTHSVLRTFGIDGSGVNGKNLEPLAMHEGFADFLAAAATDEPNIGEFTFQHRPPGYGLVRCVANDPDVYGYANYGNVECVAQAAAHCRSLVWSGTLWDLRTALPGVADGLVVESLWYLPPIPCFAIGYDAIWAADFDHHGGAHLATIDSVMARRGIPSAGEMLGVTIVGPEELALGQPGTYEAQVARGAPPLRYEWSQYVPGPASHGEWSALPGDGPEVTAACSTATRFVLRCAVTDAAGTRSDDSLAVGVTVAPLEVRVRPEIRVPWGGCARDTAILLGGLPPVVCYWLRVTEINTLVSNAPAVADSPVTSAHRLLFKAWDQLGTQASASASVVLPYGRPEAGIQGPSRLCCGSTRDTFRAIVAGGRPPYRCTWTQLASPCSAWTATGEVLAGSAIRQDSSFTLRLEVRDADGVPAVAASRALLFCDADSCRLDGGPGPHLRLASPIRVSDGPVNVTAQLTVAGAAWLEVHDLSGRCVADLARGGLRAGTNELRWDCRGLRPGVYFVRLAARDGTAVRKVVVLP